MKRWICLTFALLFLMSALCFAAAARSFIRGDADCDGTVSVIDATAIQKVRASIEVKSFDPLAADVDGDTIVSVIDATYIQKSLAHIENKYAIGEVVTVEETEGPTEAVTEEQTEPATEMPTKGNELPFIPNR